MDAMMISASALVAERTRMDLISSHADESNGSA